MIKKEEDNQNNNLINIKLKCNPNNTALYTYAFKMGTFNSGSPDSILQIQIF